VTFAFDENSYILFHYSMDWLDIDDIAQMTSWIFSVSAIPSHCIDEQKKYLKCNNPYI